MKFQKGQKVRVIAKSQNYIINSLGLVIDVLGLYRVRGDSFDQWFSESDLELVEPEKRGIEDANAL